MQALFEPLSRKLLPLLGGVTVGAFLVGLPMSLGAVSSGDCATFKGSSAGNDPSQQVTFNLCRRGDRLEGIKTSEGEAGRSVFVLEGRLIDDETFKMQVTSVLEDEPAPGWISCSDDVFNLQWDEDEGALVGSYVSVECEDRASLHLTKAPPVRRHRGCGS